MPPANNGAGPWRCPAAVPGSAEQRLRTEAHEAEERPGEPAGRQAWQGPQVRPVLRPLQPIIAQMADADHGRKHETSDEMLTRGITPNGPLRKPYSWRHAVDTVVAAVAGCGGQGPAGIAAPGRSRSRMAHRPCRSASGARCGLLGRGRRRPARASWSLHGALARGCRWPAHCLSATRCHAGARAAILRAGRAACPTVGRAPPRRIRETAGGLRGASAQPPQPPAGRARDGGPGRG